LFVPAPSEESGGNEQRRRGHVGRARRQAAHAGGCLLPLRAARPVDVAKLIERHGPDTRLPDLREILAGDCPRSSAVAIHERCGVHYLPAALLIGMSKICRSIAHSCSQRSSNPQIG
jgi:hypothetical protein